jgi:hypothetical protein
MEVMELAYDLMIMMMVMMMVYILVVARDERLLMAPFCKYDEMVDTNPSCDGDLAVLE